MDKTTEELKACKICNNALVKSEAMAGYDVCEHCEKLKTSSPCWATEYGFECPYCKTDNYDQACAKLHTCSSCKKEFIISDSIE